MGIKQKQLSKLQQFKIGSFAVWDGDLGSCSKKFLLSKKVLDKLHGRVIFLGLNRSGKKPNKSLYPDDHKKYEFVNFHSKKHKGDRVLRSIIENKLLKLEGAYMTDLYEKVESKSGKIKLSKRKLDAAIVNLKGQINSLANKTEIIICFGNKVFNHLFLGLTPKGNYKKIINNIRYSEVEFDKKRKVKIYRVWHYSNWGTHKEKIKELKKQLKYINNELRN